jgi:N-acetylmuramoyl-L-alanine amidase
MRLRIWPAVFALVLLGATTALAASGPGGVPDGSAAPGGIDVGSTSPSGSRPPLAGRVIVLDPGHNGGNFRAPAAINRLVSIGQGVRKACDTTGTATASGYTEADYNWDVAKRTRRVLRDHGARVLLTRKDNHSVGPCIDERARIANRVRADLRVSIHADGGPPTGYGFHVIEPSLIRGLTDDIFAASHRLAVDLRDAFTRATGEPFATYVANDGLARRSDLGGLRLSNVPSVFIETGNMRSVRDARLFRSGRYRLLEARGIARGIERFLQSR